MNAEQVHTLGYRPTLGHRAKTQACGNVKMAKYALEWTPNETQMQHSLCFESCNALRGGLLKNIKIMKFYIGFSDPPWLYY